MSTKTTARRMAARSRARAGVAAGLALAAWSIPQTFGGSRIVYTVDENPPKDFPHAKRVMVTD